MFNVNQIDEKYDFEIKGASYIGKPQKNTVMFVSKKVESLVSNLVSVNECLVFAEKGIVVEEDILLKNCVVFTETPQLEYVKFVSNIARERHLVEKRRKYTLTNEGYYLGENVIIGKNAYIEPGCLIGHDVILGDNICVNAGAIIKNAIIGNNVVINEKAVVGAVGFTMVEDQNGNKMRMPTLGKVIIGNDVEIGALDNISCGSGGDTVIEDYVKIDALCHIGHDVHLCKNVEITAGCIVGGFTELRENAYMGINSSIRNRLIVEKGGLIGMGATVTKSVEEKMTVVGNPAKPLIRKN